MVLPATDSEHDLEARDQRWVSLAKIFAVLAAVSGIFVVVEFSTHKAMPRIGVDLGSNIELIEDWTSGANGELDASATAVAEQNTLSPAEYMMPPVAPALLDSYYKEMVGIPDGQVTTAAGANACFETEELFEHLCYRRCSLLTNGTFPLRTTAWSCCNAEDIKDCFVNNQDRDLGLCSGYDVGGDGQSCPHAPGKCLDDEELFLGQCYAKCSVLTHGAKPFRTSPISCCETKFALSCFSPSQVSVSPGFAGGGGKGDGNPATPGEVHEPLVT